MKADVITESPAEPPANVPVLLARLLEPLVEDAIDQLAVLSGLGSRAHGAGSGPTPTVLVGDEISEIIARQRELELEYDKVLGVRAQLQQDHNVELLRANDDKLRAIAKALKQSTSSLCAALRMTNASGNAMVKFQNDRQFAQLALEQLLDGLRTQAPSCQVNIGLGDILFQGLSSLRAWASLCVACLSSRLPVVLACVIVVCVWGGGLKPDLLALSKTRIRNEKNTWLCMTNHSTCVVASGGSD